MEKLNETMMDDLAEARLKELGSRKVQAPRRNPIFRTAAASSSKAVKKETGTSLRTWSSRARSRTPSRTVLKKAA